MNAPEYWCFRFLCPQVAAQGDALKKVKPVTVELSIESGSNVDTRDHAGVFNPQQIRDASTSEDSVKQLMKEKEQWLNQREQMAAKIAHLEGENVRLKGQGKSESAVTRAADAASLPEGANTVDASPRFDYYASIINDKLMFNVRSGAVYFEEGARCFRYFFSIFKSAIDS